MESHSLLDTGIKNACNVGRYIFGKGSLNHLNTILQKRRKHGSGRVVYFFDTFFKNHELISSLSSVEADDLLIYVDTSSEPTTTIVNEFRDQINRLISKPSAIVGIGGGSTLDVVKGVANLLTNGGLAEDYQGWDLLKKPAIYKIGIPTISGTGAEATRTCVMVNKSNGLKLGMNSDFTVFDQVIMDPELTATVPKNQYFWTGMDAYIHCIESLSGQYRNAIGDAFSVQTISLCREVFLSDNMQNSQNREKLMVASYLGGCAIATSYVGVIHPFSAGLSVVLGVHHCLANCIVMSVMEDFYADGHKEFSAMVDHQEINIPKGICFNLSDKQFTSLYESTIIHEKPLTNALGNNFKDILTKKRVIEIFQKM